MKTKYQKFLIYLLLIILTIVWCWYVSYASAAVRISRNPAHIPVIWNCTTYTMKKDCGRRFREYLDTYSWHLCQIPNWRAGTCEYWMNDQDLLLILNNLEGWHK